MGEPFEPPPTNPVLRYLAILSAARDFGLTRGERDRIASTRDPRSTDPDELARELADALLRRGSAA